MGRDEPSNEKGRWNMMNERNVLVPMGLSLLTGLLIGGIAGVLYAPQSGVRTRRQISNFGQDMKERAGEMVEDTKGSMEKLADQGRRMVHV